MSGRDLRLRIRALLTPRRVERELDEELAFHIERDTQQHAAAGLSRAEARRRALARFGSVPLAADQCRDARGTAIIDDLLRDIGYAIRTFRRAPLAALTIIATVALGLGLVAVGFTVYSFLMLRVDAVRDPAELFAVKLSRPDGAGGNDAVSIARADYEAMRRETSVFADVVAVLDAGPSNIDGRAARPMSVTGNFFQMLGVQAALGRTLLPDDEDGRAAIVLSEAGWRKLFQGDPGVIGRGVVISGAPYEVVGVMPDGFRGLAVTPPDFWLPLAVATRSLDPSAIREAGIEAIGRLQSGQSREAAAAAVAGWASGRAEFRSSAARPIQVWLIPRQGTLSGDGLGMHLVFAPLLFAFGLILTIGCANVANLLLARGVSRQREIGTRIALGASRRRIIRQLLTESVMLSLAAAACGLILARLLLEGTVHAVITTLPPEIGQFVTMLNLSAPTADWRVIVFVLAGALVSTAFFGLAPALQSTRLDVVRTMRGELTRDARPSRARHTLVALQVGASALLLICAGIFLRGALGAATRDAGVRTTDTVWVNIDDESRRGALLSELRADPMVAAIAASTSTTAGIVETRMSQRRTPADRMGVSSGYFDVLGFELVSGRGFTPAEGTVDAGVVVVSEVLARQLWPTDNAVGQMLRLEASATASSDVLPAPSSSRTLTVVGVVRDQVSAAGMKFRGVYIPTGPEAAGTSLTLRVRGNPEQARVALAARLPGLDPGFGVMTLRTVVGMQAYVLGLAFWAAVVLGALALVLTVSGLFSVLSYVVAQQTKEIGVRMALGAATKDVMQLVLAQSLRPVAIGLTAGGGLAAAVAVVLRATPLAAEIGDSVDVLDPVAYVLGLLVIVSSCVLAVSVPAARAARIDPIATLRKD